MDTAWAMDLLRMGQSLTARMRVPLRPLRRTARGMRLVV